MTKHELARTHPLQFRWAYFENDKLVRTVSVRLHYRGTV